MKSHITVIVVAGVVVVGLAAGIFTAYPLESAQTRLDRQINEKVDTAQRMLLDYRPITTELSMHLGVTATQPVDVPPDQWQADVTKAQQEGPAGTSLRELSGRVQQVNSQFGRIQGEQAPVGAPASGNEAYRKLQADLQFNDRLLANAIRIVQEAINLTEGELSGASHPGATRLEAVLCYQRADQLRREAAAYQAQANDVQARFMQELTWAGRLAADLASTQRELGIPTSQPASAPVADAATSAPATQAVADSQPTQEAPAAAAAPAEAAPAPAETAAAKMDLSLPPLDDRIAHLEQRKTEVAEGIEKAQAEVARLTKAIEQIKQRIAVASREAADSEQEMLKLQQKGVDPADPEALKRFTEAYEKAATANRAAYREKTTLAEGSLRGARVDSTDEEEILNKPLAPAKTGEEITTERGLVALESDLKAAQATIDGKLEGHQEGLKAVAAEIDRQIVDLRNRKKDATDRLARLQAARARIDEQLIQSASDVMAAAGKALQFETEGLDMAEKNGMRAAKRAKQAVDSRISSASSLNAEHGPDSQNQRLLLISKDTGSPGHAQALIGDMELLAAQIQAARAETLDVHTRLLAALQQAGIPVDAKLLPKDMPLASAPPELVKLAAARAGAEQARTAALDTAKQALEAYAQADNQLQQLWVLHANMATVHHLMANLTTGKESLQHAKDARIEYLRATKGREERPEVPSLQSAMASLTTRPAK